MSEVGGDYYYRTAANDKNLVPREKAAGKDVASDDQTVLSVALALFLMIVSPDSLSLESSVWTLLLQNTLKDKGMIMMIMMN